MSVDDDEPLADGVAKILGVLLGVKLGLELTVEVSVDEGVWHIDPVLLFVVDGERDCDAEPLFDCVTLAVVVALGV